MQIIVRFLRQDTRAEMTTMTATNHSPYVPMVGDEVILGPNVYVWMVKKRQMILKSSQIEWLVFLG